MKTYKKLGLRIAVFIVLSIVVLLLGYLHTSKTYAAGAPTKAQAQGCINSLHFVNFAQIQCDLPGMTFTDVDPTDPIVHFSSSVTSSSLQCGNHQDAVQTNGGRGGSTPFALSSYGSSVGDSSNNRIEVVIWYGNPSCQKLDDYINTLSAKKNPPQDFDTVLSGGVNSSAQSLSAITSGSLHGQSFGRYMNGAQDPNPGSGPYLFSENLNLNNGQCNGYILVADDGGQAGQSTHGTVYKISTSGNDFSNYSSLANVDNSANCKVGQADFGLDNSSTPVGINIYPAITGIEANQTGNSCTSGQTKTGYTCQCNVDGGQGASCTWVPSGTGPTGSCDPSQQNCQQSADACEANSGSWELSWLACPVLNAADSLANTLTSTFEQQLSFRVTTANTTNAGSDLNNNGGQISLRKAWDIIKYVASALLIIVMLIMVISQAFGGGPFDAYTVRKMLPRLVAAVILMQISWYLVAWSVDAVDDLGKGVADIMYSPFGGPGNLNNFFVLLHNAHVGGTAIIGSWVGLIGVIIAGAVALPAVLMFCFMAIVSVLTGLAVLIFRKIFIILALIFAPVIILAWILPGTQNLYKKATDAFLKILMMFPIVMAIIAGGRIFAYVVGTQDNGTLINFFLVLVGFFGPLFILPKSYKWGGEAMKGVGEGAFKAAEKGLIGKDTMPMKYFRNRQEAWTAERRRQSQERLSGHREYGQFSQLYNRPLDKFKSGAWDPLRGGRNSRQRFEAVAGYEAAGRESSGKTYNTAVEASKQLFDNAADHDYVARMLMRGGSFQYIDKRGRMRTYTPPGGGASYMRAAGAAGIVKYGTDRGYQALEAELDRMRAAGGEDALLAEQILDENVERLKPKNDALYRGFRRDRYDAYLRTHPGDEQGAIRAARYDSMISSVDSMKENWFDGMEGATAQSYLASLSHGLAAGDERAPGMTRKLWQTYQEAVANPQIHISPGVHKAFKAWADGTGLDEINNARQGEVVDRVRGDIENPDGSVTRYERDVQVRDHPALDTIISVGADDLNAAEVMARYDSNGVPIAHSPQPAEGELIVPREQPPEVGDGYNPRPGDRSSNTGRF